MAAGVCAMPSACWWLVTPAAGAAFSASGSAPTAAAAAAKLATVSLEISVPPGMLPGDELRLAGQGEPASDELAAGDLFLTIVIRSHPLFQLRGRDIHFSMPVSALALLAGRRDSACRRWVARFMTLEPGSPEPREVRLAGKGYPGRGRHPGRRSGRPICSPSSRPRLLPASASCCCRPMRR